MSARSMVVQIAVKAGMLLVALLVFTILLAALPAHRAPAQQPPTSDPAAAQAPDADHSDRVQHP